MDNRPDAGQLLKGKVALVTGGAGGIGTAICHHLAAAATTVVVTFNSNGGRAEALVDELPGGHFRQAEVSHQPGPGRIEPFGEAVANLAAQPRNRE